MYEDLSAEMLAIVSPGENIVWVGRPKGAAFQVPFWFMSLFGLVFLGFMSFAFFSIGPLALVVPHFWIGLAFFLSPLYGRALRKRMLYAATDKRIMIQRGLIGRDFTSVDWDKITNMDVDVGIIDKMFGTGTITFSTGATPYGNQMTFTPFGGTKVPQFRSIEDPYNVFSKIKKVSFDIKTDVYYPNQYRPGVNPGYNTSYSPRVEVLGERKYVCMTCNGKFNVDKENAAEHTIRCPYCGSGNVV